MLLKWTQPYCSPEVMAQRLASMQKKKIVYHTRYVCFSINLSYVTLLTLEIAYQSCLTMGGKAETGTTTFTDRVHILFSDTPEQMQLSLLTSGKHKCWDLSSFTLKISISRSLFCRHSMFRGAANHAAANVSSCRFSKTKDLILLVKRCSLVKTVKIQKVTVLCLFVVTVLINGDVFHCCLIFPFFCMVLPVSLLHLQMPTPLQKSSWMMNSFQMELFKSFHFVQLYTPICKYFYKCFYVLHSY